MKELYAIMEDLLMVEYNQQSLLWLIKTAETAYSEEKQAEAKYTANSTKYYLEALQDELKAVINKLDDYLIKEHSHEK
ncbi:MAG: hypothetical protein LUI12_07250 [Clostridiales bacterium]|nr:hypothetical protein [Clostridiales bacterium]